MDKISMLVLGEAISLGTKSELYTFYTGEEIEIVKKVGSNYIIRWRGKVWYIDVEELDSHSKEIPNASTNKIPD